MNSDLGRFNGRDILTALANSAAIAIIVALYGLVTTAGFDIFSADWTTIGKQVVNAVFIAFIASVGGALGLDKQGKILGRI